MTSPPPFSGRQPKVTDWLRPHLQWITFPSWLLSIAAHALTIFLCVLLSQTPSCRTNIQGEGGESFRDVGIFVRETIPADSSAAPTISGTAEERVEETSVPSVFDVPPAPLSLPAAASLPVLGAGGVPALSGVAALSSPSVPRMTGRPGGARGVPDPRGGGGTSLFGASDRGSKFVYVIDRSWSMEGSGVGMTPMSMAKSELIASIARLDEQQQFQIVMYNEAPSVLVADNGRFDYFFGTDAQRLDAVRQLSLIQPTGGTNHFPALRRALDLAPDVVFFLTDGQEPALSAREIDQIARHARGARIHCVEFGKGPPLVDGRGGMPGNWLKKLASENGGQYVYHDVTGAPRE